MKTTLFETESLSLYEIDVEGKRMRRLRGRLDPTPRQGRDGEWKKIASISDIVPGHPVLIEWVDEATFIPDSGATAGTLTSAVRTVWENSATVN